MGIGRRSLDRQGQTLGIRQHMSFAAIFRTIGGIRSGVRPPKTARTLALSMTARSIAAVAAVLKTVTLAEAQELAKLALSAPSAAEARSWVRAKLPVLDELGL